MYVCMYWHHIQPSIIRLWQMQIANKIKSSLIRENVRLFSSTRVRKSTQTVSRPEPEVLQEKYRRSLNALAKLLGARVINLWLMPWWQVAAGDSTGDDLMLWWLFLAVCYDATLNTATPSILQVLICLTFLIRFEISSSFVVMCGKMLLAVWPYCWDGLLHPQFDLVLSTPVTTIKRWNISF